MTRLPPKVYQWLVGLFASLGSFLFGYDLGVIAEVLIADTFLSKFEPSESAIGLVVAMFTAGAFFGAGMAGPAGDYLGRRGTIVSGAVVFILGGALQTGARGIEFLWAGRFIAGLGVGALVMIVPLYQAELAHPSIRGRVTAIVQFMIGIGAFLATWIGFVCFRDLKNQDAQWRIPLGIQIIPAVVLAALTFLFPESPRWLMDHGKGAAAQRALARLHAHGDVNDPFVVEEYENISKSIEHEHSEEAKSYIELFRSKASFRRLVLCCAVQAAVQMSGVSAIQYYSPAIYGQIGISQQDTLKYQGISNGIAIAAQMLTMVVIDYTGRRWVLIGAMLFNMVTFIIGATLIAEFPPGVSPNIGAQWGFIVITWLFNFSFSFGCGPLSWIIPAEVFDTRTRSKGVSIATMTSFAFNTMIGQVTGVAMNRIGWRFYLLFIVCNFTNALFFWLFLPETARRSLETMNVFFTEAPWLVPGRTKKFAPPEPSDSEAAGGKAPEIGAADHKELRVH